MKNYKAGTMKILFAFLLLTSTQMAHAQPARTIDVTHYIFRIAISDNTDGISAVAQVSYKVLVPTDKIILDLVDSSDNKGMAVSLVRTNGVKSRFIHANKKLQIELGRTVKEGDTLTTDVHYSGVPKDGLIIAKNKYGNRTFFSDNWPDRARHWLACVDDPADKASVEFIVTSPVKYDVVSNGVMVEESSFASLVKERKLTHWKEDVALPTKIMVIGVAEFAVQYAGDASGIPVYSWVYPENRTEGFYDYAQAVEILPFFINYIGPYGYRKLANVQSKTRFGGMENAGAIFYSENSVSGKRNIEGLLAHEIAHQWFGDMATEKSFAHVWLSEGFATYFTNLYMENKYGKGKLDEMLAQQRNQVIAFSRTHKTPVIDTGSNYMELLNENSYQKGGWILHMLRRNVGDDVFRNIIRKYYATYAGSNADSDDLRRVAEEVSGKDLKQFFDQWLRIPGQPALDIKWKYDETKKEVVVTITQLQDQPFMFPLTLLIDNTLKTVDVSRKSEVFTFKMNKPQKISADPATDLLAVMNVSN